MPGGHTVYLGLGANLGDRLAMLNLALRRLGELMAVRRVSPLYETAPVGYAAQPDFLNLALEARTQLAPRAVLRHIKAIERALGRPAALPRRFGPRCIDIDLLFYDGLILRETDCPDGLDLRLPHPRAHERAFVLVPLADIAPRLLHPELGETIAALRARVDDAGVRRVTGEMGGLDEAANGSRRSG
jgi:2-amino-4-hydroxy-6-hydroxymethyldihydropteridine diphosphokinase